MTLPENARHVGGANRPPKGSGMQPSRPDYCGREVLRRCHPGAGVRVDVGNDDPLFEFGGGGEDRSLAVDDGGRPVGDPLALETSDICGNERDAVLHGSGDEHIGSPSVQG
jgi:hypothetical protein